MRTHKATTPLMILGLAFAASTARATLILSDNFNNAVMNNGVLESVLNYGPATATSSHNFEIGTLDGNALHLGDGSGSIYITAALPQSISLENVGDFVQMTFDFTTIGHERGNRVLRYGFFAGAPDDNDAFGYFAAGPNQGSTTQSNDMNGMLAVADGRDDFYTVSRPSERTEPTTPDQLLNEPGLALFRVERISATELLLSSTHGGLDLGTHTHMIDENSATSIDEIWFGIRNRGTNFTIDNLQITAIPEPSTLLLVGSVLVGFLLANKTRRR